MKKKEIKRCKKDNKYINMNIEMKERLNKKDNRYNPHQLDIEHKNKIRKRLKKI